MKKATSRVALLTNSTPKIEIFGLKLTLIEKVNGMAPKEPFHLFVNVRNYFVNLQQ